MIFLIALMIIVRKVSAKVIDIIIIQFTFSSIPLIISLTIQEKHNPVAPLNIDIINPLKFNFFLTLPPF